MKSPFLPSFSGAVVVAIVISTLVSTLMVNLLSRPFVSVVSERVEQINKFFFGPGEDMTGADWAKRIIHDGDLILFFRHAERDKWDSVVLFDHFEVLDGVDGRDQSYSGAVCLSEKGREEAGIIRRAFGELDVPVSRVFSSPSCRAQETARLGFGRVDETWTSLLHTTAVPSDFHEEFGVDLRSRVLSHLPAQGEKGNLVLSSHGRVLAPHSKILFGETNFEDWELGIGETGFVVIEPVAEGDTIELVPRFVFNTFLDFWLAANDQSLLEK